MLLKQFLLGKRIYKNFKSLEAYDELNKKFNSQDPVEWEKNILRN